jgi:deoxycytidylate deaminase
MSRTIEREELRGLDPIIEVARQEANQSTCRKDHRGAVVFKDGQVLGVAFNGPPLPLECKPEICSNVCGLYATHAEQLAIVRALARGHGLEQASVLHVRVDDGQIQVSGELRCENCTGYMMRILRKGIPMKEFILLQKDGWTAYTIPEADKVIRENLVLY